MTARNLVLLAAVAVPFAVGATAVAAPARRGSAPSNPSFALLCRGPFFINVGYTPTVQAKHSPVSAKVSGQDLAPGTCAPKGSTLPAGTNPFIFFAYNDPYTRAALGPALVQCGLTKKCVVQVQVRQGDTASKFNAVDNVAVAFMQYKK